jgi:pimeloyl-ACP methyl ester carboxylesterase
MRERKDYTQEVFANPSRYVFIHGEMDTLVSTENLQKRLPGITIHLISNAGHMSHIESSSCVMDILMEEKE